MVLGPAANARTKIGSAHGRQLAPRQYVNDDETALENTHQREYEGDPKYQAGSERKLWAPFDLNSTLIGNRLVHQRIQAIISGPGRLVKNGDAPRASLMHRSNVRHTEHEVAARDEIRQCPDGNPRKCRRLRTHAGKARHQPERHAVINR